MITPRTNYRVIPGERSWRAVVVTALVVVTMCAGAQPSAAQPAAGGPPAGARPYRGIFGGNGGQTPGQDLSLGWTLLGANDINANGADNSSGGLATGFGDPRYQVNGTYASMDTNLTYALRRQRASLVATGSVGGRYFPELSELSALNGGGSLSAAAQLARRTRVNATGALSYVPYYAINALPSSGQMEAAVVPPIDYALTASPTRSLNTTVQLDQGLNERTSINVMYAYWNTRYTTISDQFKVQFARAGFNRNLTRHLIMRLGYGYGAGQMITQAPGSNLTNRTPIVNHDIDVGVDYSRPLSFSRRTTLTFGSGSTVIVQNQANYYRLIADAQLNHQMGRSWNANAGYDRGVQYLEGFGTPLFADTITTGVGGLITRRLEFRTTTGYSKGVIGLTESGAYNSYNASTSLRIAFNQRLSFYAQYIFYHYNFDQAVELPIPFSRSLNRNAVRIGLSGWLPLLH